VIVSDDQGLFSSSSSERQFESLVPKFLPLFVLEIDENLYLHHLRPDQQAGGLWHKQLRRRLGLRWAR
jgi:hypothetical protein